VLLPDRWREYLLYWH